MCWRTLFSIILYYIEKTFWFQEFRKESLYCCASSRSSGLHIYIFRTARLSGKRLAMKRSSPSSIFGFSSWRDAWLVGKWVQEDWDTALIVARMWIVKTEGRQCAYNVTMKHVLLTIVTVVKPLHYKDQQDALFFLNVFQQSVLYMFRIE